MQICRYLRIAGRDKTCELGVCPVMCMGCSTFQPRRPFDPPTHQVPQGRPIKEANLLYTNPTLAEEQAAKMRMKSSVVGGCGCHKNK